MNGLCESILKSIDDINDSCIDARIAITEANIELEEKYLEMAVLSTQNGYVQESMAEVGEKVLDFLERKPDESVIRTILLAIPRLIANLILYIKDKWDRYSIKVKCAKIKDQLDALNEKATLIKTIYAEMGSGAKNAPPGCAMTSEDLYVASRIINVDKVVEYYNKMKETFEIYAKAIEDGSEKAMENFIDVKELTNDLLTAYVISTGNYRNYGILNNQDDKAELDKMLKFAEEHDQIVSDINKATKDLHKWVNDILNDKSTAMTKDVANTLLTDGRTLHDAFLKADNQVLMAYNEMLNTIATAQAWYNTITEKIKLDMDRISSLSKEYERENKEIMEKHPEAQYYDPAMFEDEEK